MLQKPLDESGWIGAFGDLPEASQARLRHWFATQALIIEDLGVAEEDWFGLVSWALDHPFDKEHLLRLDDLGSVGSDGADTSGAGRHRSAALGAVGASVGHNVATGGGLAPKEAAAKGGLQKELYQRFMNQRMNETTRRPKGPPPAKPIKR